MNNPKISVIVPVYKVEDYLAKCLDSIVGQTYRNLEIILVDDGSPDNCGAICDEYAARDDRITVIHQENGGVSAARNAGLDAATGDWIGFADGDDWLEKDMYEYLAGLIDRFDADVVQCGFFFDEGQSCETMYTASADCMGERATGLSWEDWHKLSYANWNKLYRASVVGDLRFDPRYGYSEDLLFNVYVLLRTGRVCFGSQAKYHYLQRQESACHRLPTMEYLYRNRLAMEYAAKLYDADPVARRYFCEVLTLEALHTCSKIVRFYTPEYEPIKKQLRGYVREKLWTILRSRQMPVKEKGKSILLAFSWTVYSRLLLASKKT